MFIGMFEFRVFWDKWRLCYDNPVYCDENGDETGDGIHVFYIGPFIIARHYLAGE